MGIPSYPEDTITGQTATASDLTAVDVPVVIIGGGPTGLFQAHLLSQLGGMFAQWPTP